MTHFCKLVLILVWGILLATQAIAQDQPRFALVIGNEQYEIGALRNPVNDARSMTASLVQSGFKTKLLENVTAAEFEAGITGFLDGLPAGSIGLFYYAGHAIQRDGRNYLLPFDVKAESADTIIKQSIDAAQVLERFHKSGVDFSIFILDACRNNPFLTDGSEQGRGLASMESDAGETLIGFATQAGEVAYDGAGPNSPYTGALINEIAKPGKDILDVFRSVRRSVRIWTNGRQRPFISASIERQFTFKNASGTVASSVDIGELTLQSVRPVVERIWWDVIQESPVPGDFRNFVNHFPDSKNVDQARNLVIKLEQSDQSVRGIVLANFSVPEDRRSIHGLSAVVTPCDIVAGDPDDPRRISDGVP
ncbi:MAG: caspase family protein [Rhodobacteraceae bacterium]|nr:caspase family protein [Paracoccaceae bacterium]